MLVNFELNCRQINHPITLFGMILHTKFLSIALSLAPLMSANALDVKTNNALDSDLWEDDIPVVLTATKLKQAQSEAPASVTVIDKEMIQGLGTRKLVEILRLVPGMQVGYVSGNTPAVGYHGLTDDNSRRLQVLVDGRSVYQQALSRILWEDLPISIENIARIEVIRGPNTATYGANSYMAVINIITERPSDNLGWNILYRNGQRGVDDSAISWAATNDNLEYRINVSHKSDNGFDLGKDGISQRYDSQSGNAIEFDGYRQQSKGSYRLKVGYKQNRRQIAAIAQESTPFHNQQNKVGYIQFNYSNHINENRERKIQAYYNSSELSESWNVCLPRLFVSNELFNLFSLDAGYAQSLVTALSSGNPLPPPTSPEIANLAGQVFNRAITDGSINTCGDINQNLAEQRLDFEWEETLRLNQQMRVVSGINFRHDTAQSESFFRSNQTKNIARLYSHYEWKATPSNIFNMGANVEYDSEIGSEISPRLAFTHHLDEHNTLRIVTAMATRTPDLFEESGYRSYVLRNITPTLPTASTIGSQNSALFYQHSGSSGGLSAEKIRSWEIGYFGQFMHSELLLDVKLFNNDLYQLLDGSTKLKDFNLKNGSRVTFTGVEAQLNYRPSTNWRVWTSYSHVEIDNSTTKFNIRSVMKDSGSLAIFYKPQANWQIATATYANSTWFGQEFLRTDLSLMFRKKISNNWQLRTRLTWQHRFDDDFLFDSNNNYSGKNTVYFQLSLSQ